MPTISIDQPKPISAGEAISAIIDAGYDFATGVPCSYLSALISGCIAESRLNYLGATSEGEAVCLAAGAWFAGRQPLLLIQNSGLGNAVNPLTSLNATFKIPLTCFIGWRGKPDQEDEPQHRLMGKISPTLVQLLEADLCQIPQNGAEFAAEMSKAARIGRAERRVLAYLTPKQTFEAPAARPAPKIAAQQKGKLHDLFTGRDLAARANILGAFLERADKSVFAIASTGYCGRELFTLGDRDQNFYQVGSMGGAAAIGLGIAINSSARVVVFDGDGALLMKLGSLATVGAAQPERFLHVVLDNGAHESTGGQATASGSVAFAEMALACGYRWAAKCDTVEGFVSIFQMMEPGPGLIHMRIRPGALSPLGRPTIVPDAIALRMRKALVPYRLQPGT